MAKTAAERAEMSEEELILYNKKRSNIVKRNVIRQELGLLNRNDMTSELIVLKYEFLKRFIKEARSYNDAAASDILSLNEKVHGSKNITSMMQIIKSIDSQCEKEVKWEIWRESEAENASLHSLNTGRKALGVDDIDALAALKVAQKITKKKMTLAIANDDKQKKHKHSGQE